MKPNSQLKTFLEPYSDEIKELAIEMRDFITQSIPEANELIWDNYNAVAIAYSKSERLKDAFCHIAVYAKHLNVGFNRGVELSQDILKLEGKGKLIRHIKIVPSEAIPKSELKKLILEAIAVSDNMSPDLMEKTSQGKSVVMSISEKKIRPTNKK